MRNLIESIRKKITWFDLIENIFVRLFVQRFQDEQRELKAAAENDENFYLEQMNDEEKQLEELMKAEEELEKRGDEINTDSDDSHSDSDSGHSDTGKRTKKTKRLRKPRKMLSSSDSESDAEENPSVPFQVPIEHICVSFRYLTCKIF